MELDARSFLAVNPNWSPADESIGVTDLGGMLTF